MRISADTAYYIQTAAGTVSAVGGSMLFLGSFGRVCFVPDEQGRYELSSQGLTKAATVIIAASFFANGYIFSGKVVRQIFDVDPRIERATRAR